MSGTLDLSSNHLLVSSSGGLFFVFDQQGGEIGETEFVLFLRVYLQLAYIF